MLGEVVGVHIDEGVIVEGKVDVTLYRPVARLGYRDYSAVDEVFALVRPEASFGELIGEPDSLFALFTRVRAVLLTSR